MYKQHQRSWGRILSILGVIITWKPVVTLIRLTGTFPKTAPLFKRFMMAFAMYTNAPKIRLTLGFMIIITGIILIIKGRKKYWEPDGAVRIKRAVKKIQVETDLNVLDEILRYTRPRDIMEAAKNRKFEILYQCLESGENLEAVRSALDDTIARHMHDTVRTDFLAAAAKKHPEIVKEFWPRLQKWAHQDSNRHTDHKPGHIDRPEWLHHTDTRVSYGDCHDDKHEDSYIHDDNPCSEKIVRFKPYIPKEDVDS